jgi:hypothetical protein
VTAAGVGTGDLAGCRQGGVDRCGTAADLNARGGNVCIGQALGRAAAGEETEDEVLICIRIADVDITK